MSVLVIPLYQVVVALKPAANENLGSRSLLVLMGFLGVCQYKQATRNLSHLRLGDSIVGLRARF
jgi:hypothetical protein